MPSIVGRVVPLVKEAVDALPELPRGYKPVEGTKEYVRQSIPIVRRPDMRAGDVEGWLLPEIESSVGRVLRHKTVALKDAEVPDLERLGFRKTRLAVPLPGEKGFLPISYRKGRVHVHDMGDTLLAHTDKIAPEGVWKSITHGVTEGIPAYVRRIGAKKPVKEAPGAS